MTRHDGTTIHEVIIKLWKKLDDRAFKEAWEIPCLEAYLSELRDPTKLNEDLTEESLDEEDSDDGSFVEVNEVF